MQLPSERYYSKDHEWVLLDGDTATIGITEFAQSELGEIVFVELPEAGKEVAAGDTLCVVESTKAASDVYSPIAGVVKEANAALEDAPDQVNEAPYEGGWMVVLEQVDNAEVEALMNAAAYEDYLKNQ